MNRRVSQNIDYMNFNSAKLSVKLCETLRDILFFYFLVTPLGWGAFGFLDQTHNLFPLFCVFFNKYFCVILNGA